MEPVELRLYCDLWVVTGGLEKPLGGVKLAPNWAAHVTSPASLGRNGVSAVGATRGYTA
jgi:hypothetical protein